MSLTVTKDPDNKWYVEIDWGTNWLQTDETIVASSWGNLGDMTEGESTFDATTGVTTLVVSGGTLNTDYSVVNTITYSKTALSISNLTEDRTIKIKLRDK